MRRPLLHGPPTAVPCEVAAARFAGVWHELRENKGGTVELNLDLQTLTYLHP
ncbi:hypothetical protein [Streptacidiphilus albus]|uniref:hypothetical protein n=1 Tax=Streptacidiphilus albus TaxID=105425 RepID=UPI0012E0BA43|nr:hypothetical protein [Streptacidiphilus albus]